MKRTHSIGLQLFFSGLRISLTFYVNYLFLNNSSGNQYAIEISYVIISVLVASILAEAVRIHILRGNSIGVFHHHPYFSKFILFSSLSCITVNAYYMDYTVLLCSINIICTCSFLIISAEYIRDDRSLFLNWLQLCSTIFSFCISLLLITTYQFYSVLLFTFITGLILFLLLISNRLQTSVTRSDKFTYVTAIRNSGQAALGLIAFQLPFFIVSNFYFTNVDLFAFCWRVYDSLYRTTLGIFQGYENPRILKTTNRYLKVRKIRLELTVIFVIPFIIPFLSAPFIELSYLNLIFGFDVTLFLTLLSLFVIFDQLNSMNNQFYILWSGVKYVYISNLTKVLVYALSLIFISNVSLKLYLVLSFLLCALAQKLVFYFYVFRVLSIRAPIKFLVEEILFLICTILFFLNMFYLDYLLQFKFTFLCSMVIIMPVIYSLSTRYQEHERSDVLTK